MSRSKQKGTAAETEVVRYLKNFCNLEVMRNPPQGQNDKGDIYVGGLPLVIEVKNCARMELSEWLKEAAAERNNASADVGVVWHKKRGKSSAEDWFVTMSGADFMVFLSYMREHFGR